MTAATADAAQPVTLADRHPRHLIASDQPTQALTALSVGGEAARLDAGGTMWRLRSLLAMGHDAIRIARALDARSQAIRKLIRGDAATVSSDLRDLACQLWDAWWDKRPPERTQAERRAASRARQRAERHGWCAPLGLDEDDLDEPGYRPYSLYRPATGTGVAADFHPAASRETAKEIA